MWKPHPRLPDELARVVAGERRVRTRPLEDDGVLAASDSHVTVVRAGEIALHAPWCDVARVTWDETSLTLTFIDPQTSPLTLTPARALDLAFLTHIRECIESAQILSQARELANGTIVTGWVLRDASGRLHTRTTASGPIDAGDAGVPRDLEARVREAAGLT